MSDAVIDPARFRQVLGSYPTGVCAITAMDGASGPIALVVGTFTSVSLDPPLVGFLPDKGSNTWPRIASGGKFCVNVLGSDQQALCRQLASKGTDKFVGVDYSVSDTGLPVLAGCIARIDCDLHSVVDAGDHWFVLGRVQDMEVARDDDPMLFHRGRYGGFADLA